MRVKTATPTVCPRCQAPVTGDFKFCPECAHRLRPGRRTPTPEEPPRPGWPHLLMVGGGALLLAGIVTVGWILFRGDEPVQPHVVPSPATLTSDVITVEDILRDLVRIEDGVAYLREWSESLDDEPVLIPVYVEAFKLMRVEVTRGQYAEFLEAVRDDPDLIVRVAPTMARQLLDPFSAEPESLVDAELATPWEELAWRESAHLEKAVWAQGYVDYWWGHTSRHVKERLLKEDASKEEIDRLLERPADLSIPLPAKYRDLVMAPPEWVRIDTDGTISWTLPPGTENLPVTEISLYDARAFADWARDELNLPSLYIPRQAEWTRAYHGGHPWLSEENPGSRFPWGNRYDRYGCNNSSAYSEDEDPALRPVTATYGPWHEGRTADGLYSMAGNAREWVMNEELQVRVREDAAGDTYRYYEPQFLELGQAPTLGGSFLLSLDECDRDSLRTEDIRNRKIDVGFRLAVVVLF